MDLWFNEKETDNVRVQWKVEEIVCSTKSRYQRIDVADLKEFGRTLILDGIIQTSSADEYMYHEMLVHVPLVSHPKPRRVLVVGGGDGGSVREVLKHPVEGVDLVEIDEEVIRVSREYLPFLAESLDDPRVRVVIADGLEYVKDCSRSYDCVLIDSSDPIGPAAGLFSGAFYRDITRILEPGGLLAAQTESPLFNRPLIREVNRELTGIFPEVGFYWCSVPSYSIGPWSFALAGISQGLGDRLRTAPQGCRYYNHDVHRAAFALPNYFRESIRD